MSLYLGSTRISNVFTSFKRNNEENLTDTSDATLSSSNQLLDGVSAYSKGEKIIGSIPSVSEITVAPSNEEQTIVTKNTYVTGDVKVSAMPSGEITDITVSSQGLVSCSVSTSGYLNSQDKTLQLTSLNAQSYTPTESAQTIAAGQYITGTQTINAIPNDYIGSAITKKSAQTYTPTESVQTIASGQYLSGVQTIGAIPNNYIGSAVVVQSYYTGEATPSDSMGANGDLYLKI